MREVKFRGKRKDNGEWIKGYLVVDEISDKYYIFPSGNSCNEQDILGKEGLLHILTFEVIPETVGQYTGLKDKNRTEIYEGDIVQQYNIKANGTIIYKYGQFGIVALGMFWNIHSSQTEVIGNIHDNPELLEVKHE